MVYFFVAALVGFLPSLALAEAVSSSQLPANRKQLIPEIDLVIRCLEAPPQVAWKKLIDTSTYSLYVESKTQTIADGQSGSGHNATASYLIAVDDYPCFYTFSSVGGISFGTLSDSSSPTTQ